MRKELGRRDSGAAHLREFPCRGFITSNEARRTREFHVVKLQIHMFVSGSSGCVQNPTLYGRFIP